MSHIKDRLKQYADKYSDRYKYAGAHVQMINLTEAIEIVKGGGVE